MQSFKTLAEQLCDEFGLSTGKQNFYDLMDCLQKVVSAEVMDFLLHKLTERFVGVNIIVGNTECPMELFAQWERLGRVTFGILRKAPSLEEHPLLRAINFGDKKSVMKLYGEMLPHSIESK